MKTFLQNVLVAAVVLTVGFVASVLTGTPMLAFVIGLIVWHVIV